MNETFPTTASFVIYLLGLVIAPFVAYWGMHLALMALEGLIGFVADLLPDFERIDGGNDDDDFSGYADMVLPQVEGMSETATAPGLRHHSV
jgi:hypothetical protein